MHFLFEEGVANGSLRPDYAEDSGGEVMGVIESALSILRSSDARVGTIASNVSNAATPGFKRQVSFSQALGAVARTGIGVADASVASTRTDFSQGRMTETGNSLDLAIAGDGFFRLRNGDQIVFSRHGQFQRGEDGTVMTEQGYVLQQLGGGDLVVEDGAIEVLRDGTVLSAGASIGRIALSSPPTGTELQSVGGGSLFEGFAEDVAEPDIRQGALEASNVALGDEMTAMMIALRHAETGARLVTVYDELLGRAITAFSQGGGR
jgi:flagellar basal-body rod protein FlgG